MTGVESAEIGPAHAVTMSLCHVWFIDIPTRTLCGQPRDTTDPGQPLDAAG